MLEIELKFPVPDFTSVEAKLQALSANRGAPLDQRDLHFNAPDRDFKQTDEALRIRMQGSESMVTYKGPKRDSILKSRTELEVPLGTGPKVADNFARLLQHLGYRPVATVVKRRVPYHMKGDGFDVEICLDDVEGLGTFVEVEIVADEPIEARAKAVATHIAGHLQGVSSPSDVRSERRSYLHMLLEKQGKSA